MHHKPHMFSVPEHILELMLDHLRVSDCAACSCVNHELRSLSQVRQKLRRPCALCTMLLHGLNRFGTRLDTAYRPSSFDSCFIHECSFICPPRLSASHVLYSGCVHFRHPLHCTQATLKRCATITQDDLPLLSQLQVTHTMCRLLISAALQPDWPAALTTFTLQCTTGFTSTASPKQHQQHARQPPYSP